MNGAATWRCGRTGVTQVLLALTETTFYSCTSSAISVTSAAIGDRSERVSVTCCEQRVALRFSTTATTPSWPADPGLSRWATSW